MDRTGRALLKAIGNRQKAIAEEIKELRQTGITDGDLRRAEMLEELGSQFFYLKNDFWTELGL